MANIQERRNKEGTLISYSIRVHRGRDSDGIQLKPFTATFDVQPTWTEKTAQKKAEAFAATFEKECKIGVASDTRQTFENYCNYVIGLKEQNGIKHSTIVSYKSLTERIYPIIGYIKLSELRPQHLNSLYGELQKEGLNKVTGGRLSNKTVLEHHRLISTVLEQASKEMLIPFNLAKKASLPKAENKAVNYFEVEDIERIRECLESESQKWRMITHMLLITGARRGEILGLKWDKVDWKTNKIYIDNNILYSADIGIYEDTPKTAKSCRYISLPIETMNLLKEYRGWQNELQTLNGDRWHELNFVFTQENGKPMHPDSVTDWLNKFAIRHDLPHINPHAFRHTMASLLYFNGVDAVSISSRLGHAKVSTTADIYSHIMKKADEQSSEKLADIFLRNTKDKR